MLDTAEVLRLMLATLALGVTLPIMIQLFLMIRQVRKTIARLSHQIEPTLQVVNEVIHRPRDPLPQNSQLASIVATIVPAAIAAYRAYRQHQAEEAAQAGSLVPDSDESGVSPAASK